MQLLHDRALTEPDIQVHQCRMPFSLSRLLGMHQAGSKALPEGLAEPDPGAPVFEQYQAASAAHWIATYCLKVGDSMKVSDITSI